MIRPVILFLFFAWTSLAAEKWVRASTPNFELYTPLSEKNAKEKVLYFEQLREFMSKSTGVVAQDSRIPVRIILFQTEKQFEPYRPNEVAAAYYLSGLDRDFIAIGGAVKESERVAVHEYVHLVARHAKLNFPVWLNEGFADLYSNLQPRRNNVLVGSPIIEHIYPLREHVMPLSVLLNAGHDSAQYNRKAHAGTFYAQSWALTHMLQLDPQYKLLFREFLAHLNKGIPSDQALEKTYSKSLKDIEKDLLQYIQLKDGYYAAVLPIKFEKANVTPVVTPVDEVTVKAVLASLHVAANRMNRCQIVLKELEHEAATNPHAAETLAYASWRKGEPALAQGYFTKALANIKDPHPKLLLDTARIHHQTGDQTEGIRLLRQALAKDPNWQDARLHLAEQLLSSRQPEKALEEIRHVKKVRPDLATRLFITASYIEAANKLTPQAKASADAAQKYAKSMWEKESVGRLREYLSRVEEMQQTSANQPLPDLSQALEEEIEDRDDLEIERPRLVRRSVKGDERIIEVSPDDQVLEAEGYLVQMDCQDGKARMHLEITGAKNLILAIHDPKSIVVRGGDLSDGKLSMECGAQRKKIRVDYVLKSDSAFGTDGVLKILEMFP